MWHDGLTFPQERSHASPVDLDAALAWAPAAARTQAGSATQSVEPFKLGTFGIDGQETVGVVLRDAFVVDLGAANALTGDRPA